MLIKEQEDLALKLAKYLSKKASDSWRAKYLSPFYSSAVIEVKFFEDIEIWCIQMFEGLFTPRAERYGGSNNLHWFSKAGFFKSPASHRFHGSVPGGLALHSISVAIHALEINDSWYKLDEDEVIVSALLHDLAKIGIYDFASSQIEPRYIPNSKFNREEEITAKNCPFNYNTPPKNSVCAFFPIWDLSPIYVANLLPFVPLPVVQAVRLNDGFYLEDNRSYRLKAHPLSILIHKADEYAGLILEEGLIDMDNL